MRIRTRIVAFFALLLTGGSVNVWAVTFSSLYAFGDSLSDAGSSPSAVTSIYKILNNNCDLSHPCPPYEEGRFSNGPVASEYLAEALFPEGVTATNFHSYAIGGATSGIGNYGDGGTATEQGLFNLPGMNQELELYKRGLNDSGDAADPNALFLVWGGANDYLTHDSPIAAAQNIGGYVGDLAEAGAKHILVPNLMDLSKTPFARAEGEEAQAQAFSFVFNTELATQLGMVSSNFPTTEIFQFDTYSFVNNVIQDPASYGFTEVQDPCLSSLFIPCGDPGSHLFWDDSHPTTSAHAILGSAFASAVPEPQINAMFMAGLFVIGVVAYRRRQSQRHERGRGTRLHASFVYRDYPMAELKC